MRNLTYDSLRDSALVKTHPLASRCPLHGGGWVVFSPGGEIIDPNGLLSAPDRAACAHHETPDRAGLPTEHAI